MKLLLPLTALLFAVLACGLPETGQRRPGSKSDATSESDFKPRLQYSKPRLSNESGVYYLLTFEVKNLSDRPLEFVQIEANFYDKDDNLLRTETPYIHRYESLGPGERSAAEVQTTPDKRIKRVELNFSCHGEQPFSKVQIKADEVDKVSK
jgi:hypothetical protein